MRPIERLEQRRLLSVSLLKDVNPGAAGSAANWHLEMNGLTFFTADDGVHGTEQFVSDGSADGTRIVLDINPTGSSSPAWHRRVGDLIYFTADDGTHGRELWKTDGTAGGTSMVVDINPTGTGIPITNTWLTAANGLLYFAGTDGANGIELWKSDGTPDGTVMVKDIHPTSSGSPQDLIPFGNKLAFSAIDQTHGRELWISDGTSTGTAMVKDINTIIGGIGTLSSTPNTFFEFGGALLFRAVDTTTNGVELWRTDGTELGTHIVKDINPSGSSQPFGYCTFNGFAYFTATGSSTDTELYRTDGTDGGTSLVKDIYAGTLPSSPSNLTVYKNELWFSAESSLAGRELWASDGTAANTRQIKDIRAGGSSSPDWFTVFNDALYFTADDGSTGKELWRSDGTGIGTARVHDINTGSAASTPFLPRIAGNALYFFATTATAGSEYWRLQPPQVTQFDFNVDTRTLSASFDQDVVISTAPGGYNITQLPSNTSIAVQSVSYNAAARTAQFTTAAPLPDGNYRLTLPPAAVADVFGNRLIGNNTFNFYTLTGDANRDRVVNFDDLLILAQNYGSTGKTFSQGNFDYDAAGNVGFDDLLLLAQRYGASVLVAAPTIRTRRKNSNIDTPCIS